MLGFQSVSKQTFFSFQLPEDEMTNAEGSMLPSKNEKNGYSVLGAIPVEELPGLKGRLIQYIQKGFAVDMIT